MGPCFSSPTSDSAHMTAIVITVDGSLKEYTGPVTVSSVLGPCRPSFFLCNSDNLYLDTCIPALDSEVVLDPGQVYFVLPVAKLGHPLSVSDMAGMAVKASSALVAASEKHGKRRIQIMPVEISNVDCIKSYSEGSNIGGTKIWSKPFEGGRTLEAIVEETDDE